MTEAAIVYTYTDEAPFLATHSLLPIIEAYAGVAGVPVQTRDISLAGRILAAMHDYLPADQQVDDALAELGELAKAPEANIVKLPNISASVPQLKAAIAELQAAGYKLPDYPEDPQTDDDQAIRKAYDSVKGSAVNPVLREGNSDRRAPESVKSYARKNPHRMGQWSSDSKTNVATMSSDDFRHTEKSVTMSGDDALDIVFVPENGEERVLRGGIGVLDGEVIDCAVMRAKALNEFLKLSVTRAEDEGILFSAHLKATMMKVSDPIIFGHVIRAFFPTVFAQYGEKLEAAGISPSDGLGAIFAGLENIEGGDEIRAAFDQRLADGPDVAMVNSHKGITNLHVPSDVIIDASMPAMIRTAGHMWNADDAEQDCLAVIPDSSYAGVYQTVIEDCRANGAYDPTTMGSVPNVGLMAKKAEEYGSHDKTFEMDAAGSVEVRTASGEVLMSQEVAAGDLFRACQTKDVPVRDWVKLAVTRARATGDPAVFWLDADRAHDAQLIKKVETYLADHDTEGLDISIKAPEEACKFSIDRIREGKNTISVTGNVLRDYLTDLFPILELGTSAKMLSVVPLIAGGGLFETGAGGSAPKHVEQLTSENYLRWDSLGEFLALAESFEKFSEQTGNANAAVLGKTLDAATGRLLDEGKSPARKLGSIDNRGSHFYLALYWAEALAGQADDAGLAEKFAPLAENLRTNEQKIAQAYIDAQGKPADIGGYYRPDPAKVESVMRPVAQFNEALASLNS